MKKIIIFISFILLIVPSLISAKYSFSKLTWSKCTFLVSGTISLTAFINGVYYQKLSDDAYKNYKKSNNEATAISYRIVSENYNSLSAFWKNVSLISGIVALTSAGLDYFIFGKVEKSLKISFSLEKKAINLSMKF
ncbi:MAG: hypothetical protein ACTSRP_17535 [Candidatus Helarchaeota archaeon]